MNFGIKTQGKYIFCANCGRVVSETGEYDAHYCFKCGNPLKIDAIQAKEKEVLEIEKNYIHHLKEVAEQLETNSFEKILTEIED